MKVQQTVCALDPQVHIPACAGNVCTYSGVVCEMVLWWCACVSVCVGVWCGDVCVVVVVCGDVW